MTSSNVSGLDEYAQNIINQRLPIVQAFLECHLSSSTSTEFALPASRLAYYPLAEALNLRNRLISPTVHHLHGHGLFDRFGADQRTIRPPLKTIETSVRTLVAAQPTKTDYPRLLMERGICGHERRALTVMRELRRLDDRAAGIARTITATYIQRGGFGLLTASDYPCYDELLIVEQYHEKLFRLEQTPPDDRLIAYLRSTVTTLYTAFSASGVWQQYLLHEPPTGAGRQRYLQSFSDDLRQQMISKLSSSNIYPVPTAVQIIDYFLSYGLAGLVALYRSTDAAHLHETIVKQQIDHALKPHLAPLHPAAQTEIRNLLVQLRAASLETGIHLSFVRLINELPSSPYRRRYDRRFWFGRSASAKRHQRKYRKRRDLLVQAPQGPLLKTKPPPTAGDQLVTAFAGRANLPLGTARTRLRDFITYGAFGLIPQGRRRSIVDKRLVDYLHLLKLGRLDGAFPWREAKIQLDQRAEQLGIAPFSPNVFTALVHSLPKQAFWNSGQGEHTAAVRHRPTLLLDAPLLHREWVIVPVRLNLTVADDQVSTLKPLAYACVVIDIASQLPMGCWVSTNQPTATDYALALYDAIWHPFAYTPEQAWPLRGIPERIILPTSVQVHSLTNLVRATTLLCASIDQTSVQHWQKLSWVKQIQTVFSSSVSQRLGTSHLRLLRIHQELIHWLYQQFFVNHRSSDIPSQFRKLGVTMPGSRSPVAGWLIPSAERPVATIRNAVVDGSVIYTHPEFIIEPHQHLTRHAFPYALPLLTQGMFVEVPQSDHSVIWYLRRSRQTYKG